MKVLFFIAIFTLVLQLHGMQEEKWSKIKKLWGSDYFFTLLERKSKRTENLILKLEKKMGRNDLKNILKETYNDLNFQQIEKESKTTEKNIKTYNNIAKQLKIIMLEHELAALDVPEEKSCKESEIMSKLEFELAKLKNEKN